ncbi:MAG: hypothetical protein ACUVTH_02345 [Thermogutta sp.]
MNPPPATSRGFPYPTYGSAIGPGPNSAVSVPGTASVAETVVSPPGTTGRHGLSSAIVQPYATPYALPPNSSQGSAPGAIPLTAEASQTANPATPGWSMRPPATGLTTPSLSTAVEARDNQSAFGTVPTQSNIYGGWSPSLSSAGDARASHSLGNSTLPTYPHYSSGFGTAIPFPSPSQPNATLWNGGASSPRQTKTAPSLMDLIRTWWADVTAPKGIEGRQALLPPGPSPSRLLGAGFRGRSSVPTTDPFSNYGVAPGSSPLAGPTGSAFPHQSPAVLPPSSQWPVRQAR